jgi:hypothetical protein
MIWATRVDIFRNFATADEAADFAAQFPKSMRLHMPILCGFEDGTIYSVGVSVTLNANGTNGGVNEAGIKRARRFLIALIDSGTTITYAQIPGSITVEEFLAATA